MRQKSFLHVVRQAHDMPYHDGLLALNLPKQFTPAPVRGTPQVTRHHPSAWEIRYAPHTVRAVRCACGGHAGVATLYLLTRRAVKAYVDVQHIRYAMDFP